MASNTIKKQAVTIYTDREAKSIYNIPISVLKQRHNYGCALVSAWHDLFLLYYISSGENPQIKKITGFSEGSCLITSDGEVLTLTFDYTVWEGISVLPL